MSSTDPFTVGLMAQRAPATAELVRTGRSATFFRMNSTASQTTKTPAVSASLVRTSPVAGILQKDP